MQEGQRGREATAAYPAVRHPTQGESTREAVDGEGRGATSCEIHTDKLSIFKIYLI